MKRIKSVFSAILSLAVLLGCLGITPVISSAESSDMKFYLTEDYRVSGVGVTDQINYGAGGTPQIRIASGTTAKVVVEAENLSEASHAVLSYAQNGGSLSVKLTALETADAESGTNLVDTVFTDLAANYYTRLSGSVQFKTKASENEKYLAVELSCEGSLDSYSYIDYVELINKTIVSFSSLSDSTKLLSVKDSGTVDGDVITASDSYTASTSWTLSETETDGYYRILNNNSGKGIGVWQGSTNPGASVVQWTTNSSLDQQWRFVEVVKDGTTYYKILNRNSNLVLTVNDDGIVTQQEYTEAENQLWSAEILFGTEDFGREYDRNYSINNLSARAADNVITYSVAYTYPENSLLEVSLYKDEECIATSVGGEGDFNITDDGTYTIVASLYEDDTKEKLLCEPASKTIIVEGGKTNTIEVSWTSTTEHDPWVDNGTLTMVNYDGDITETDYIEVDQNVRYQTMDDKPWGGCFADRGWMAMSALTDEERKSILESLFGEDGLRFTAARLPLGNNDYSDTHKSYNEITGESDYDMEQFSIATDEAYLIPYIKLALEVNPDIEFFSTPWSPPSWMKQNKSINGVDSLNTLNYTPEVLEAYAKYFVRYLEEYSKIGINVSVVTPQNEPTMNTAYASCVWTGEQLNEYIRDYLYDAIDAYNKANNKDVKIWLGTFTDSQESMCMPTLTDEKTINMIDGVSFQWWGAPLSTSIYKNYPGMRLVQSETKCGDGNNNWRYAEEQFDCFKEFLDAGVNRYYLWNMVLNERGENTAARPWRQNAPITVDSSTAEIIYRPSYYLTKHFSYYIDGGARRIKTKGSFDDTIAFQNTDGTIVIEVKNDSDEAKTVVIKVGEQVIEPTLQPHSLHTFRLQGTYEDTVDATYDLNADPEEAAKLRVKLENKETADLLSVRDRSTSDDADITHEANLGESYQLWELAATENDYYEFVNQNSGKLIAVYDSSMAENARVVQWNRANSLDQQWKLEKVEKDNKVYYAIINRNSGLALSALQDENLTVTQLEYTGADNQLWAATVVSGELPGNETEKVEIVSVNECSISEGVISYSLNANEAVSDYDVYVVVYDSDGRMSAVKKNEMSGEFSVKENTSYTMRVMLWEKDSLDPVQNVISCNLNQ